MTTTMPTAADLRLLDPQAVLLASALAQAHGHTWGGLHLSGSGGRTPIPDTDLWIDEAQLPLPTPLTAESIRRQVYDHLGVEPGCEHAGPSPVGWGIVGPTVGDNGAIVHTTGSGRLNWEVRAESLTLTWSRPSARYCQVDITWYDGGPAEVHINPLFARPVIFARHVEYVLWGLATALQGIERTGIPVATAEADWVQSVQDDLDYVRQDESEFLRREARELIRQADALQEAYWLEAHGCPGEG